MLLTIIVGLYSSRVLLGKLGFEDYGIYNVVGGIIVLFSFLSTALNSATQRFLSFELGTNNILGLTKAFSTSVYIYIFLSLLILIGSESIGLYFLNFQMNFPANRLYAVNWIYQISIITFVLNTIRTPYNAAIISNERMSFYAYTGIFEAISKLAIIYLIDKSNIDRLIFYAILVLSVSLILLVWYIFYCHQEFPHLHLQKEIDRLSFKEMFKFSGWSLLGSLAVVGSNQGINILLNLFFGVLVNAGMGIANQVTNVINQFASNFQVAFNPQIVKGYANNEIGNVTKLVYITTRISFYLLFVISIPFFIDTDYILRIWLGNVPEFAEEFTLYLLLSLLIEAIAAPLYMTIQATGNIKTYQIIVSLLLVSNLIIGYVFLKLGFSPISVVIIRCVITFVLLLYRIKKVSEILRFSLYDFFYRVIFRLIIVGTATFLPAYYLQNFIDIKRFLYLICTSVYGLFIIYLIGLNANERIVLKQLLLSKIKKQSQL